MAPALTPVRDGADHTFALSPATGVASIQAARAEGAHSCGLRRATRRLCPAPMRSRMSARAVTRIHVSTLPTRPLVTMLAPPADLAPAVEYVWQLVLPAMT